MVFFGKFFLASNPCKSNNFSQNIWNRYTKRHLNPVYQVTTFAGDICLRVTLSQVLMNSTSAHQLRRQPLWLPDMPNTGGCSAGFGRGLPRYQPTIMKTRCLAAKLPSNTGSATFFSRMFFRETVSQEVRLSYLLALAHPWDSKRRLLGQLKIILVKDNVGTRGFCNQNKHFG